MQTLAQIADIAIAKTISNDPNSNGTGQLVDFART
jgi:hypothetical protein